MLFFVRVETRKGFQHLLFIHQIGDPEHTLSLFNFRRVEVKPRASFVEADAMRKANGCRD